MECINIRVNNGRVDVTVDGARAAAGLDVVATAPGNPSTIFVSLLPCCFHKSTPSLLPFSPIRMK